MQGQPGPTPQNIRKWRDRRSDELGGGGSGTGFYAGNARDFVSTTGRDMLAHPELREIITGGEQFGTTLAFDFTDLDKNVRIHEKHHTFLNVEDVSDFDPSTPSPKVLERLYKTFIKVLEAAAAGEVHGAGLLGGGGGGGSRCWPARHLRALGLAPPESRRRAWPPGRGPAQDAQAARQAPRRRWWLEAAARGQGGQARSRSRGQRARL